MVIIIITIIIIMVSTNIISANEGIEEDIIALFAKTKKKREN